MLPVLAILVGLVIGFVGSRRLRRPERAAQAASVARRVEGSLGGRRSLTPPELQRACFSEMIRHVQRGVDGAIHAPSHYDIHLHPDDLTTVGETRRWFTDGLVDALTKAATSNGWRLAPPVEITYEGDPNRHRGVPEAGAVAPQAKPGVAPAPSPGSPSSTATRPGAAAGSVTRLDTGATIALREAVVTIGRSRDRTIVVDDDRVSRSHAHLEPDGTGWAVVDDGSSNGTRVNGVEIAPKRPHLIRPGDVIAAGPLELRVEPSTAAGTRTPVLDDGDRTRIVGDALPPGSGRP